MLCIEPELEGNCSLGPEGVTVLCETNLDNTMVTLNYSCSYNEGPPQDCEYIIKLDSVLDLQGLETLIYSVLFMCNLKYLYRLDHCSE